MATFNFRGRDPREFRLAERPRQRATLSLPRSEPLSLPFDEPVDDDNEGWLASSYELRRGLDVSEESIDTLPAELQDAFAPKAPRRPTR